jgi:hypothetical protein
VLVVPAVLTEMELKTPAPVLTSVVAFVVMFFSCEPIAGASQTGIAAEAAD